MKAIRTLLVALLIVPGIQAQTISLSADSGIAGKPIENCKTDLRYLNQVLGWQSRWPLQWQNVVSSGPENAQNSITYWSKAPDEIYHAIKRLKEGLAQNETSPVAVVKRIQQQVNDLTKDLNSADSKYLFQDKTHNNSIVWNTLFKQNISTALNSYSDFLKNEYLPNARKKPGLSFTKDGEACFLNAVTWWTGLDLSASEIEKIGWQYLNETNAELLKTGNEGESFTEILERLKTISMQNTTTAEELISISKAALTNARSRYHLAFSQNITQKLIVTELPKHLQAGFPAGRYSMAQAGKSEAQYIINPSRPNERRLMAEVIAFHEGIPGHHLWSAYKRNTPALRLTSGTAGLLEGWAIYSEYLADELSLYSTTLDRQGMIAKHLWAASRLIVEPGIHLKGWSREKAINFMLENTLLSQTEIEVEVDRYIAMPGQSLSYILGADVILSERKRAQETLKGAFNLKDFHDVILLGGSRPLSVVRSDIKTWVQMSMSK